MSIFLLTERSLFGLAVHRRRYLRVGRYISSVYYNMHMKTIMAAQLSFRQWKNHRTGGYVFFLSGYDNYRLNFVCPYQLHRKNVFAKFP